MDEPKNPASMEASAPVDAGLDILPRNWDRMSDKEKARIRGEILAREERLGAPPANFASGRRP